MCVCVCTYTHTYIYTYIYIELYFRLILGNYLAQNGEAAKDKLKGCFIISVPWNVFAATKNIEDNYINLMLNKHLASNLCRTVKKYYTSLETGLENVDMNDVLRVSIK